MTLPNFLIIGAMRAGTTSLVEALSQHPDVIIPSKEPHFFSFEGKDSEVPEFGKSKIITRLDVYKELFEGRDEYLARGDGSPSYLPDHNAAARIKHHVPDIKMIAVLRDPIDRAYSNFCHEIKFGRNPSDNFKDAIRINDQLGARKKVPIWATYTYQGFYFRHLSHYFDIFDRSQIKVYLYEDWSNQPQIMLHDIYNFLEIDCNFEADVNVYGKSGNLKSRTLHDFFRHPPSVFRKVAKTIIPESLNRVRRRLQQKMLNSILTDNPPMDPDVELQLRDLYKDDIIKLQDLIQRDLSQWLRISA